MSDQLDVTLTGWAEPVFAGEFSDEFMASAGGELRTTERLSRIPPYLFAELERKIEQKKAAGVDVISLGIGDPDMPTPEHIVRRDDRGRPGSRHAPVPVEPRPRRVPRGGRDASTGSASA